MKLDELKNIISDTVKEQVNTSIEPLKETQRKYESIFIQQKEAQEKQTEEKTEPGILMARVAKCIALAKNDPEKALNIATGGNNTAKGMYPNDKKLHAALKDLSVGTPSEGGFLVREQYSNDIIPLLTSKAVVMQMGARRVPMPGGNLNLPKLTGGATAYYIGESANPTASQQTFGNLKMSSKKLVVLVPISNDLIRTSNPAADAIVRDDMINQAKLKIDYTSMYGNGTEYTPKGVKPSVTATYSCTTASITGDTLATMISTLMANNSPMLSPGWIFNSYVWSTLYNLKTTTNQYIYRDEMRNGKLEGHPFGISNQITTANSTAGTTYFDMFFGDWSEFMFGEEMSFELMASSEASWYDGSSLQSAFSLDQTVLKITMKHDMALRHTQSFLVYNRGYNN